MFYLTIAFFSFSSLFLFLFCFLPGIYVQAAIYAGVLAVYFSPETCAITFVFASLALFLAAKNKRCSKRDDVINFTFV